MNLVPRLSHRSLNPLFCLVFAAVTACVPGVDRQELDPPPPSPSGGAGGRGGTGFGGSGTGGTGFGGTGVGTGGSIAPPPNSFLARPAVSSETAPPALSGGTLLVLADGRTAFAADPDRDLLYFADLTEEKLLATVPLQAGDEPGRAVEDATGGVHVVLRRGGAVLSLGTDRSVRERRAVCPAPRGIAFQLQSGALHVACAGGELVTLPAAGGAPTRTLHLDRDLRDVIATDDELFVTRFRSGELLVVSALDGQVFERRALPGSAPSRQMIRGMNGAGGASGAVVAATPGVAWRMRPLVGGGAAVLHQESSNGELGTTPGGYGGGPCKAPIGAAITRFGSARGSAVTGGQLVFAILPIDFAESRDGKRRAMVLAGNVAGGAGSGPQIFLTTGSVADGSSAPVSSGTGGTAGSSGAPLPPTSPEGGCMFPNPQPPPEEEPIEFRQPVGDAIAVDFDGRGRVVVQTREPARLEIISHRGGSIKLAESSRFDSGHAVFHLATSNGLACASCHPEGGDDGRVWRFAGIGGRRTQNLQGGIAMTAPFHWDGDMRDLGHLMTEVFSGRMGGPAVATDHVAALGSWMNRLPIPARGPSRDPGAVERGRTLFHSAAVACATCHTGPLFTNNQSMVVGTGKAFQVPSLLGIGGRAPFMHDGCAKTLADRFTAPCGGGDQHGKTSQLSATELGDLVTYLESL